MTILAALISSQGDALAQSYKGYETPAYQVIETEGAIEIRDYESHLLATIAKAGGRSAAASSAFRPLANYIFGANDADQKMKMTAPVTQTKSDTKWEVSFILPQKGASSEMPRPNNQDIKIHENPAQRLLVIQFSGRWGQEELKSREDALRAYAMRNEIMISGEPIYMFYDDPFTLPWRRRNEIAFRVIN